MAKKKKHKKHNFNQSKSKAPVAELDARDSTLEKATPASSNENRDSVKPAAAVKAPRTAAEEQHLQQIKTDVRRVIILAASFVAIQVALWFLFEHTGVGPAVYGLIHR